MPPTSANHPPASPITASERPVAAALYLRGDGPQRDAMHRCAKQLRVSVVKEFVDRDHAAQAVTERVEFRTMLAFVETHPEVRYVITPTRACVSRRQLEVATTKRMLATKGVSLVIAEEEVGERPMAEVMEAIADIMHGIGGGSVS